MGASRNSAPAVGHGDLAQSILFIFPLFLIYEAGVVFTPVQNGVDFVSRLLFAAVGGDRTHYLLVHLGLAVVFVLLLLWLRRRRRFDPARLLPVVLESAIYALTLGTLIVFIMRDLIGMDPSLSIERIASGIVLSLGAGVHEELVFRLALCGGGILLARVFGFSHGGAVALAFVLSSVLFSLAHHVGPRGDPFAMGVFVYRFLAGLVFATIFYFRSLGHAVYTHAFYDLYVILIR